MAPHFPFRVAIVRPECIGKHKMGALSQFTWLDLRDLTALTCAGKRDNLVTARPEGTQAATACGKT
jgi:hypothetical protein